MTTDAISHCLNCETDLQGMVFCGNCGQRNVHRRLVWRSLVEDLNIHILEWDLPWLKTIRDLTIRPGKVCSAYADGHRIVYVNPIKYVFYILAFIVIIFGLNDPLGPREFRFGLFPQEFYDTYPTAVSYIFTNIPLYLLLMSPVAILIFRIVFWRSARNWVEITCFVFYMIGHCALLYSVMIGLEKLDAYSSSGDISVTDYLIIILIMSGIPLYIAFTCMSFFKSRLDWSFIGAMIGYYVFVLVCGGLQAYFMTLYLPILQVYSQFH